jgi:hypothetical protein
MEFTKTGDLEDDFWLVDGSDVFAIMPATADFPELPIKLHIGTPDYGSVHMAKHRIKWPRHIQRMSDLEILYNKLAGAGKIWCSEKNSKVKITLSLSPSALLILELRYNEVGKYWSVTTLYPYNKQPDGSIIGRYPGMPGRARRG